MDRWSKKSLQVVSMELAVAYGGANTQHCTQTGFALLKEVCNVDEVVMKIIIMYGVPHGKKSYHLQNRLQTTKFGQVQFRFCNACSVPSHKNHVAGHLYWWEGVSARGFFAVLTAAVLNVMGLYSTLLLSSLKFVSCHLDTCQRQPMHTQSRYITESTRPMKLSSPGYVFDTLCWAWVPK